MLCDFVIPVRAVPQPRQRFFAMKNAATGKYRAAPFKDEADPIHGFKGEALLRFKLAKPRNWPRGPHVAYRLLVVIIQPAPGRLPKKRGSRPSNTKPDLDNIVKGVKDALNREAWDDDGRVYDSHQVKFYAAPGDAPCVRVLIEATDARRDLSAADLAAAVAAWKDVTAQPFEGV